MISRFISFLLKRETHSQPIPTFNLQLDLTYSCNLHCRHCYQQKNKKELPELSLKVWKNVIQQYFKLCHQLGTNSVLTLSGGEPLLYPFIKDLIDYAGESDKNVCLYLLSNGTLIDDEIASYLSNRRIVVQISLDGPTEETHDYYRGKDSLSRALHGAGILNSYNIPFTFQAVLQKRTSHLIDGFFAVAKQYNAVSMDFARLISTNESDDDEMLTGSELKNAFRNILDCSVSCQLHTNTMQPLWCLIDTKLGHPSSAGFLGLTIAPNGAIQLTSRINEPIGSVLKENGLLNTYYDHPLLKTLRAGKIDGCSKCEFFKKCRGDRNISFLAFGNFLGPDVHCWHWKENVSRQ